MSLLNRIRRRRPAASDWRSANATRIDALRRRGVRIGEQCIVLTEQFSTEPYLVELGNHVAVAGGTVFLTPDGSVVLGNPAKVVGSTEDFLGRLDASADTLDTYSLPDSERERLLRAHFGLT